MNKKGQLKSEDLLEIIKIIIIAVIGYIIIKALIGVA